MLCSELESGLLLTFARKPDDVAMPELLPLLELRGVEYPATRVLVPLRAGLLESSQVLIS